MGHVDGKYDNDQHCLEIFSDGEEVRGYFKHSEDERNHIHGYHYKNWIIFTELKKGTTISPVYSCQIDNKIIILDELYFKGCCLPEGKYIKDIQNLTLTSK